jgi:hypothetical protein
MINPAGMSLMDWADSVVLSVNDAWAYGKLEDESAWQDWAVAFSKASPFSQQVIPNPYDFENWRDWAMLVYPSLERS